MKIIKRNTILQGRLIASYTGKDISHTIHQLKNNKSHGSDEIPGQSYKALRTHIIRQITKIAKAIHPREELPEIRKTGAIVHIYKNKGDSKKCNNYRPVCLMRIIYKIRTISITATLAEVIHLLTNRIQYGYKHGISTMGEIIKLEQYLIHGTEGFHILLMDMSKAFDTINRTQLRTVLYKKGIPVEMITHIRRG